MKKVVFILFFTLPQLYFAQVAIQWVEEIEEDFSFTEKWQYAEGIYMNQWGQLSCDGLCPIEIDRMKGEKGRIYDDSLTSFYTYVDTTHFFYTFEGNAQVYEYGECHYATASLLNGKLHIQTETNIATHSSLHIVLDLENNSKPLTSVYILYNSIRDIQPKTYLALNGTIELNENKLKDGIVQMKFDLNFEGEEDSHFENLSAPGIQHWDGKILTHLKD